jgi:tetratricopeptide (TPR) repeat protein
MYKTRICKWKLPKNCKATEKEEIARCMEAQQKVGVDLGQPMVNGKIVNKHLIERHCKERRANTPHAKRTRRKSLSPGQQISFSRITDPTEYRNMECVLSQVNLYYSSKLEHEPHVAWATWKNSSKMPGGAIQVSYTFQGNKYTCQFTHAAMVFERYISAVRYLKDGQHRNAWRQIHEGAEMVLPCLRQEFPNFLGFLLYFFMNSDMKGYGDLRNHLLDLICKTAFIVYGKSHPVARVCHLLRGLPNSSDIAALAQKGLLDTFTTSLGDGHDIALDRSATICRHLLEQKKYKEAERSGRQLITTSERHFGHNDYQTRHRLYDLALLYCREGKEFEADAILADALKRSANFGKTDYINVLAKELLGLIHGDRGDYEAAVSLYWTALSGSLLDTGPRSAWTSTTIWMEYHKIGKAQQDEEEAITRTRRSSDSTAIFG